MRIIYDGDFSPGYTRRMVEVDHAERFAKFNPSKRALYSMPCETCGKTFVGADWRLAYKPYCSKECELAQYKQIHYAAKYEIDLFWRDFGKYFYLLEDFKHV